MRYKIRQKIFSFGDKFTIQDEYDNDRFQVKGEVFTIGNKLHLLDMSGMELVYIEKKVFSFLPKYYIHINGNLAAIIKKEITFFRSKFDIESTNGNYKVEGDITAHDFSVSNNGRVCAYVNKKWLSMSDTYMVDVDDSENQAFMLAIVIVIDQVLHEHEGNNN